MRDGRGGDQRSHRVIHGTDDLFSSFLKVCCRSRSSLVLKFGTTCTELDHGDCNCSPDAHEGKRDWQQKIHDEVHDPHSIGDDPVTISDLIGQHAKSLQFSMFAEQRAVTS